MISEATRAFILLQEEERIWRQTLRERLRLAMELGDLWHYVDWEKSNPPSHNVTNYLRWQAVVEARQEGLRRRPRKGTWLDAYAEASQRLAGRPAAGTWRTMKRAYIEIEGLHRAAKVGPFPPT